MTTLKGPTNKLKRFFATLIATGLGSGFTPKAPGTAGTVVGTMVIVYTLPQSVGLQCVLWWLVLMAGWWASLVLSQISQSKDLQKIVIDEVLGVWLCSLIYFAWYPNLDESPVPIAVILGLQFLLFRVFDILKPPPVRQLDRYGKSFPIGPTQAFLVIADDLFAGVYAAAVLIVAHVIFKSI